MRAVHLNSKTRCTFNSNPPLRLGRKAGFARFWPFSPLLAGFVWFLPDGFIETKVPSGAETPQDAIPTIGLAGIRKPFAFRTRRPPRVVGGPGR